MLPCTDKSKLIYSLQKLANVSRADASTDQTLNVTEQDISAPVYSAASQKIAVVGGMFLVQKTDKNGDAQHSERSCPDFQQQANMFDSRIH